MRVPPKWTWALLLAGALAGCATTPADVRRWAAPGDENAVARVAPLVNAVDPSVRRAALDALVKMTDSETATSDLAEATLSADPGVRGDAGAALVFNADPDLDFYAITLVADRDPTVRRRLAEGLAAAGRAGPLQNTQRAGIYLWGLTQDGNADVRAAAAEGLGTLGLDDPIDFSLNALRHDPDARVRAAAARGLGTPARAYLADQSSGASSRGEEIVAALCQVARADDGQYPEAREVTTLFSDRHVVETHWVALEAAQALDIPARAARADVVAAQAAARTRVNAESPAAPAMPLRKYFFIHSPGSDL